MRRRIEGTVVAASLCLACLLVLACPGEQSSAARRRTDYGGVGGDTSLRDPQDDGRRCPTAEDYIEESLDTNGDNVADVRKVYRPEGEGADLRKVLVCREMDLNGDGRKDIFRFYSEQGRPRREMTDGDFDGEIDSITFFEEGRMVRQELDRNHDGRPDEVRHYTRGLLVRVERDDNHDGETDVWEHWSEGRLLRIGYDTDRDQMVDFWHRAPPRADEEARPMAAPEADDAEGG